jgi:hypothetical protein
MCDSEVAAAICARCRGPLCFEHLAPASGRCVDCEHDLQRSLASLPLGRWWAAGFALALPTFYLLAVPLQEGWRRRVWAWGAFSAGVAVLEAFLLSVVLAGMLASALVELRKRWQRRSFLGG